MMPADFEEPNVPRAEHDGADVVCSSYATIGVA
jgi:hypothetical protein